MTADKNYRSYSDVSDVRVIAETIQPPDMTYNDCLKLSHITDAVVAYCNITSGNEDCIDMNRYCNGINIHDCRLTSKGQYGITIKGGTYKVDIEHCTFTGNPSSKYDIDIGNWSDQSNDLTTGVTITECTRDDGNPVRVRVLWGDKPTVVGGNVKVTVYPRFLVRIYRFLRKHNLAP